MMQAEGAVSQYEKAAEGGTKAKAALVRQIIKELTTHAYIEETLFYPTARVRHHVEEEEQDWFPQVRKAMGRKALQELGEQLAAAKKNAPSDPPK